MSSGTSESCSLTSFIDDGISKGSLPIGLKSPKITSKTISSKTPKTPIKPWLNFSTSVRIAGLLRSTTVINLLNKEYFFNLFKILSS